MDFFNKLGKKASETYKATAEATGKLAKEAKIKMKMSENKSKINDLYEEIGKKVYEKHIREENIDINQELEEELTQIDVLAAEIETIEKELLEMKDKKQCESCHTEVDLNAKFCPKCGAKQEESKPNEEEILEDLENSTIESENEKEAEIVRENLQEEIQENNHENNHENNN